MDEGLFAFRRMHAGLLLKPEKYKPEMDWVKAMSALDSPRLSMPAKTSGLPGPRRGYGESVSNRNRA